jgi:hypothetical protein
MATSMFATFDPAPTLLNWIGTGMVALIGVFAVMVIYWMVGDLFRFGHTGIPWLAGIAVSAFFTGAACWLAGMGGVLFGAFLLAAFAVGKYRDRAQARHRKIT